MDIHLYVLAYRFEALVASHLEPEAFGRYMATGTQKHTRGTLMFFEVNGRPKSPYFRLHDIEQRCHTETGVPKRSKYVSGYRVLEHLELEEFGALHLVAGDGRVMSLDATPWVPEPKSSKPFLYQELSPVSPLVTSTYSPEEFAQFMSAPDNPVALPRLVFADLLVDLDEAGHLAGHLPYDEPMHIEDCLRELVAKRDKPTKTVARNSQIPAFYRTIGRGFFIGDTTGIRYYPFPERRDLEIHHAKWWRSAESRF